MSDSIRDRVRNLLGSETEEEQKERLKKEAEERKKASTNPPVDADRAAAFTKGFRSVR